MWLKPLFLNGNFNDLKIYQTLLFTSVIVNNVYVRQDAVFNNDYVKKKCLLDFKANVSFKKNNSLPKLKIASTKN